MTYVGRIEIILHIAYYSGELRRKLTFTDVYLVKNLSKLLQFIHHMGQKHIDDAAQQQNHLKHRENRRDYSSLLMCPSTVEFHDRLKQIGDEARHEEWYQHILQI